MRAQTVNSDTTISHKHAIRYQSGTTISHSRLTGCGIRVSGCSIRVTDYGIRVPGYNSRANWVLYQINLL
jgi:hypothetical protein